MGLFSHKQQDKDSAGTTGATGLLSKLSLHRRSGEVHYDHIILRLVPAQNLGAGKDGANVTVTAAGTSAPAQMGYLIQITGPGGVPLPDFDVAHDYAAWTNKSHASDADKEASRRCWNHLKYTRVLDILGTAPPPSLEVRAPPAEANQAHLHLGADRLLAAEVVDALSPAAADLHHVPHAVDMNDPLVLQLRWFCDALQKLETVRYIGTPYSEAFVKLFGDVDKKIVFPTPPPNAIPAIRSPHSPEVVPGASSRLVTHIKLSPAGPVRVPIQYDYPTRQDMTYVYVFTAEAGTATPAAGLQTLLWRRLIREIAGVLTYFQDMPPNVHVVDFPLADNDAARTQPVQIMDSAAATTGETRAQAALASSVVSDSAGVDGIVGTAGTESVYDAPVPVDGKSVPEEGSLGADSAPVPPAKERQIPATKAAFLDAIAHRLVTNQNDPDHLVEMVGTGSREGEIQEALAHISFLSRSEYELSAKTEYNLESKV